MERQPWPSERLDEVYAEVRSLLRGVTLERFLASKPPSSVVTLQAGESCASALRTLAARGISSAPVFDEDAYTGFVDACDILTALLDIVDVRALTDDNRAFKLRGAGLQLEHQPLRSLSPTQDGALIAYRADLQATLHDVLLYGILQPNAAGATSVVHRVGVFDTLLPDDEGECAAPGTILRGISILHVISQSDIVAFLHKHLDRCGRLGDATLSQLGLSHRPVVCVPAEMSTINAFASMVVRGRVICVAHLGLHLANKVSCVGVISHSHGGGLVATLGNRDLRGLLPEHFAALGSPVLQFLTARASACWPGGVTAGRTVSIQPQQPCAEDSGAGVPPQQHLEQEQQQQQQRQQPEQQLHQPDGSSADVHSHQSHESIEQRHVVLGSAHAWGLKGSEGLRLPPLASCSPDSTLRDVLGLLIHQRLHRLPVLNASHRPVGILTLTDLLRAVVGTDELLQARALDVSMEQEVEQPAPVGNDDAVEGGATALGPGMGVEYGHELVPVEPGGRSLPLISSQALINAPG